MLSYAFQVLKQSNYENVASEYFDNIQDLFAAILAKGVAQQLKQGLYREYMTQHETLSVMRGKLDMPETIRNKIQHKQKLSCEFDELSENNLLNQIIKTAMWYLIRHNDVSSVRKTELKKVLLFLNEVDLLEPSLINWSSIQYHRHNQSYEMMINLCRLLFESMIQTTEKGKYKIQAFSDKHIAMLYEKFITNYYKRHFPKLHTNEEKEIKWEMPENESKVMLPNMYSDVMLTDNNNVLIIDAKYYKNNTNEHYAKQMLPSNNLYQIFTYVKNKQLDERSKNKKVSGLLLYARTEAEIQPDNIRYTMSGNIIGAETLDLNCDFNKIKEQLDGIAEEFFPGIEKTE